MRETPGLAARDRLLAVTTLSFDIAGLELFLPLTTGAARRAGARAKRLRDALRLLDLAAARRHRRCRRRRRRGACCSTRAGRARRRCEVLCGGEALPRDLARALLAAVRTLWNLYGPTETTIWSTVERVTPGSAGHHRPADREHPASRSSTTALNPVPIGVAGELLHRRRRRRARLPRPRRADRREVRVGSVPATPGARMYRTGDLAR